MLKTTSLIMLAATTLLSAQAAQATAEKGVAASVRFSTTSNGTDGVDLHQAKMRKLHAEKTGILEVEYIPAQVYINVGSNGTDGVDRFDEKMAKLKRENGTAAPVKRVPATVTLNTANNGTDGVDRFDSRMRKATNQC